MDLVKYKNLELQIPIKSIPDDKLNTIIIDEFIEWLSGLLSLTDETASERLEIALPAIKEHCWSMGFSEISKMFTMYADNKLNITPIPNYFDRILFGKIVHAYKQQKPVIKKEIKMPEPTEEEKELLIYEGLIFCFDNWVQTNRIINGQVWVHDHLMELNLLDFTPEEKFAMWSLSKKNVLEKSKQLTYEEAKDVIREMERKTSNIRENEYKKLRLKHYFGKLKDSKKHIKDVL